LFIVYAAVKKYITRVNKKTKVIKKNEASYWRFIT